MGEVVCLNPLAWLRADLVTNPGLFILGQPGAVATAPAAADVDTRVSITFDPSAYPARPHDQRRYRRDRAALTGPEQAVASCGLTLLGRARAAGIVRTA